MLTAFLGAYGYGNLGDELCLMEALRTFPTDDAQALSTDPEWTLRCVPGLAACFAGPEEMLALKPRRIVFGGGMFGIPGAFRRWIPAIAAAQQAGAAVHFHNLGMARLKFELDWLDDAARDVFARAASFTVRDYVSFEMAAEASLGRLPRITLYPEADIPADFSLADEVLPAGRKLLGLSIIPTRGMRACLAYDADRVRALLAGFDGHAVLPVPSTVHQAVAEEDDIAGITAFLDAFRPSAELAAPLLLDHAFRRERLTPANLKGLIARCDMLISQRKHNAIHAIGAGVPVIGLHPIEDDSLRRTFIALAHRLPRGSRCVGLEAPPA